MAGDDTSGGTNHSGVPNSGNAASAIRTTAAGTPAVVLLGATIKDSGKGCFDGGTKPTAALRTSARASSVMDEAAVAVVLTAVRARPPRLHSFWAPLASARGAPTSPSECA